MINPTDFGIEGLSEPEVLQSRATHGRNIYEPEKKSGISRAATSIVKEPMVILLAAASGIYFLTGNTGDGLFLAMAIVLVASISLYQDSRSQKALEKLKKLAQPSSRVIRSGKVIEVKSEELVPGDKLMVEEGNIIQADGTIVHSNDFSVDESLLTGESLPVFKDMNGTDKFIYKGTMVTSGLAIATVTAIGTATQLGKIGKSLESVQERKTPLESQIADFVRKMAIWGGIAFLLVWGINYFKSFDAVDSLLKALTLAMSILPEEIPVAFTTFMALGAWRLMKKGVLVKQIKTVESLGSATVICVDKTGTITQNRMGLASLFTLSSGIIPVEGPLDRAATELITMGMWASEPIPFNPMEKGLHEAYQNLALPDQRPDYTMVHEYPLGGKPPMMTHIFQNAAGERIIAAKGAPEAFLDICGLSPEERKRVTETIDVLGKKGYRLLGVGKSHLEGIHFPESQQEFPFDFLGIIAFYDPPKANIPGVLREFEKAGIRVKLVTGDNAATTRAIAKQVNLIGYDKSIDGKDLMALSDVQLREELGTKQVFTRMFPDAKLRVINALIAKGDVVAMIGDGVNDAPALKASHFGIAMGHKGTEIAKDAASLVLVDDDLSKLVDAIATGRKIYANLKKAIQYIISIHIPIILTVFIPLALGWVYPAPFLPLHVILLELIMGPTCSIVFENEPIEKSIMLEKPRPFSTTFFKFRELATSIVQGLVITAGSLAVYQFAVAEGYGESTTRTMVFMVLIFANIFLTLVNRSFYHSIWKTLQYRNKLVPLVLGITLAMAAVLLLVPPVTAFFEFEALTARQLLMCIFAGSASVLWYEVVKFAKRRKK